MTAIVSIETVLLVLLLVLVIGLLRSHAEILRRLGPSEQRPDLRPPDAAPPRSGQPAPALTGTTPEGDAIVLDFASAAQAPTLLAFLTTGCTTCQGFWESLAEPRLPQNVSVVIVAHGADRESPRRILKLAPRNAPVVMSSAAWTDYGVPGAPYFVLVDTTIRGEGVATTWEALASLVGDAIEDDHGGGRDGRGRHIDGVFAAAGIGPEDPSLYPGGRAQ
ncbi:MAG TPA: hypothetical protein VGX45_08130 [Solirubrobacteraceae bacterium]|jgi:hypothetical protein|nr:hypothetical protein [Solirubrobacteraceae bacterium]